MQSAACKEQKIINYVVSNKGKINIKGRWCKKVERFSGYGVALWVCLFFLHLEQFSKIMANNKPQQCENVVYYSEEAGQSVKQSQMY